MSSDGKTIDSATVAELVELLQANSQDLSDARREATEANNRVTQLENREQRLKDELQAALELTKVLTFKHDDALKSMQVESAKDRLRKDGISR